MKDWRTHLTFLFFTFSFVLISVRLFEIQVLKHDYYKALAEGQHWASKKLSAGRGEIFSGDSFPLVLNARAYLLYAEPPKVENAEKLSEVLAKILSEEDGNDDYGSLKAQGRRPISEDHSNLADALRKKLQLDLAWVALAHKIPPEQKERIESLGFSGLGFEEEPRRIYPEGNLAAHLLGFVGKNSQGVEQGYYGLEGYYDGDLRGRFGELSEEKGATGKPILVGGYYKIPPEDGRDLILTINRSLQFGVEKKLAQAVLRYGATSGTAIVMNPATGAVLVMASFPAYSPAAYEKIYREEEEAPSFLDPAISVTYEPGSVLKAVTMSAAVDTGTVTPKTEFYDSGPLEVSGHWIHTWNRKYHGRETVVEILQHSCNVGAAWVGLKLGAASLSDYFLKFGIGSLTGVDLEGEATGIVKPLSQWYAIDLATAAFGQGVSVTPLQLVTAFSAIANKGVMMKPYVVSGLRDRSGMIAFKPKRVREVISRETAEIMVEMLTAAVEGGEAKFFVLKRYRVAGKTGTAQIPVGGQYDPRKTNATFVGFLPSHPRFVMLVKLEEPSSSIYAAETAVPLWMDIAEDLIGSFGIPPDR